MGRAAARAIREILAYNDELRSEIRQLARHLDSGNALDISGLEDKFLLGRLAIVFDNLTQLKRKSKGMYIKLPNSTSITSFVAPLVEESTESLAAFKVKPAAEEEDNKAVDTAAADKEHDGVSSPMGTTNDSNHDDVQEMLPPQPQPQPQPKQRRVLGPAMPPPEVLQAAATTQEQNSGEAPQVDEQKDNDNNNDGGDGNDFFVVGPPPPELEADINTSTMDDRTAEVYRVMQVLKEHESNAASLQLQPISATATTAPEPVPPDAYAVLGVDPTTPVSDIKKRYWRLSLLIHPDKCPHPDANTAFKAVSIAAQTLQDSLKRAEVDKRRENEEMHRFTREFAAQQQRERQWRIARNQATKEDLEAMTAQNTNNAGARGGREAWMTELPAMKPTTVAVIPTGHQTAFSTKGVGTTVQDVSGWTRNPMDAEGNNAQLLTMRGEDGGRGGRGGGRAATAPPHDLAPSSQKAAQAVDAYNASARGKSLLEKHQEKQKKDKKRKKIGEEDDGAGGSHPWRPFDRERDLEVKPKAVDAKAIVHSMKGLSSKFQGSSGNNNGQGGRTFL